MYVITQKKYFSNRFHICETHWLGQKLWCFQNTASQLIEYAHNDTVTYFHILSLPEAILQGTYFKFCITRAPNILYYTPCTAKLLGGKLVSFRLSLRPTYRVHSVAPIVMMMSSNGNFFRVTEHLWGEIHSPRWIPHTKASDTDLWCLLWSTLEWTVE